MTCYTVKLDGEVLRVISDSGELKKYLGKLADKLNNLRYLEVIRACDNNGRYRTPKEDTLYYHIKTKTFTME